MNKHYIQLDANKNIVYGFSDAFEEPLPTDICINEHGGRQFQLKIADKFSQVNPSLVGTSGEALYTYKEGAIVERSVEAKQKDKIDKPKALSLEDRIKVLELQVEQLLKAK